MTPRLTFNDVIIEPQFSTIRSRKECDTSVIFQGNVFDVPIISSNMDTVTDAKMSNALGSMNVLSALHRFCSIEENVAMYNACENKKTTYASIGIGEKELERFFALYSVGCRNFIIDVAHGASIQVVEMMQDIEYKTGNTINLIVGNFASAKGFAKFEHELNERNIRLNFAVKVGVGPGSMCSTRVVTGCGYPQISAIQEFKWSGRQVVADGGIKTSGDVAKAIAAGADIVMMGGMLAGTEESPGLLYTKDGIADTNLTQHEKEYLIQNAVIYNPRKKYRGSASKESYEVQGKVSEHRTPEGESTLIPYKGSVKNIVQSVKAGLQSAMSYVGARTLEEFKHEAILVPITHSGYIEGTPHGK